MYSANEFVQKSNPHVHGGIDLARELLDAVLTTTGEDIQTVATEFERLAEGVQRILDLTSDIVGCVQEDWVQSIVPMARALALSARRFIEERNESLAAIGAVFTNEAGMLQNLLPLTTEQRFVAREGKTLGVLASIEVARLGNDGNRFEYIAHELGEFSAMVSSGVVEVRTEADQRRTTLIDRQRKLDLTLQRTRDYFNTIESELCEAIANMESALAEFARIPAAFQEYVSLIASNISKVVQAVQMQDITRQQTEHVRDALLQLSCEALPGGTLRDSGEARRAIILKVQALQVQSARNSTEEWITQVNRCLESILHVGSSDVVAIGSKILERERCLSSQLARIEQLEQECAADDAEIEACLAGIGELMHITKAHLKRSKLARDRMQLLNFNSMIEARHLGSEAQAVLEITRHIGRISSDWSALTDRSGTTLEAMLSSSASAEEAHRTKTRASMENLENARLESHEGLTALSKAAAIAGGNGSKIQAAISKLHDQSTILARSSSRLAHSIVLMEDAGIEIEKTGESSAWGSVLLTQDERMQIENECAAGYSSKLERSILRAALNGDAMPEADAPMTGNDVELF